MKTIKRCICLLFLLLMLVQPALAQEFHLSVPEEGDFLLIQEDARTLLFGSGGEAAIRRLAASAGYGDIDAVVVVCEHETHLRAAQRMAETFNVAIEAREAPLQIDCGDLVYLLGVEEISEDHLCYACNGKKLSEATAQTEIFILNRNTKKFHKPSCASVKQMKDKNRAEYEGTRDEVIERGYTPCKRCNP